MNVTGSANSVGPKGRSSLAQANGLGFVDMEFSSGPTGRTTRLATATAVPGQKNERRHPTPRALMPQSLSRVLVHLVFSTKSRAPVLAPPILTELHPYLAIVLNNDDCPSLQVGGVADHVHLLFGLSRTRTIAQVVENVKTSSSKWLKTKDPSLANFHWQTGYGAFSVSSSKADVVIEYIQKQEKRSRAARWA